ncbi:hypothetical protein [Fibrobacter sp. UWP2]|uniref:hypothetical protein n=1 Tax=Fibrobacter sp. UWP2 TaxID=1896216 RepID=UPI00091E49E5|nr:hypothetical protein [Fibrobacter sp. UWP2]SHI35381.1 hypothetical protein SAMN05720471_101258 [Fibrobacter sp. UWP2]
MATKFSEIIAARESNPKTPVPDEILAIRDTTPGVTDQLYTNNVIDAFGGTDKMPWWLTGDDGIKYSRDPVIPTLPMILKALGLTDDDPKKVKNARSAARKFVEDWKSKKDNWKEIIMENNLLGERGWETVKDMWKRANIDLMNEDIKAARLKAMEDAPLDYGLFTLPNIPGSTTLTKIAFPRATERLANTGSVEPQDVALELGNIGLMSIPGSGFVKAGGAIARHAVPSAVLKAKKAADELRKSSSAVASTLPGLAGAAANTAGNAVVPLTSEILDDVVYDQGEGMDERANFSVGDVLLGTAVNQAVNRGLLQMAGPLADKYSGALARGAGARKVRDILSNLGKSKAELGNAFANDIRLNNTQLVRPFTNGTAITPGELRALQNGRNIIPEGMNLEDVMNNMELAKVLDAVHNGTITFKDAKAINNAVKRATEDAKKVVMGEAKEMSAADAEKAAQYALETGDFSGLVKRNSDVNIMNDIANSGRLAPGLKPSDILNGLEAVQDLASKQALGKKTVEEAFLKHPELFNYAYWKNGASKTDKLFNALNQAEASLVVNEAGRSKFAREVADVVKEDIDSNREESKNQAKKAGVARVLDAGNKAQTLSADDHKYLQLIADNPDVMTVGLSDPAENDKFKLWLITGGNDLLRGTEAHRPLWKVE